MPSILIQGELGPSDFVGLVEQIGLKPQVSRSYVFGNAREVLCVGWKLVFRTSAYPGVVLHSVSDGITQRIDVT